MFFISLYFLQIRDGNTKAGHYCGKTLPPDFVSSARLVFIDFNSDSFINRKGFNATYTEMDGNSFFLIMQKDLYIK